METLEKLQTLTLKEEIEEEEDDYQSISLPIEITQDILSRLPIKPILQFKSVSKQWLSLISHDPFFPKLHFNRSLATNRKSFFISAFDMSTNQRHFLSAPHKGGPVTHLITLHDTPNYNDYFLKPSVVEHLNGLVFFTIRYGSYPKENVAFVVNPATRKVFKVPPPPFKHEDALYFFGFDESNTEHKILSITSRSLYHLPEFMIFSLSTYSWRKIFIKELPPVVPTNIYRILPGVCVNSVIHLLIYAEYQILAFDLKTEKISIINLPTEAIPPHFLMWFTNRQGKEIYKLNDPFLIKHNGLLGIVCHDLAVETNEIHLLVLQDYVNRVWVRETITFSESWIDCLDTMDDVYGEKDVEKLVFSCRRLSRGTVEAFILDMKTKSFKSVKFNLRYPFLHSKTVKFHQVRSYVESILPVTEERTMDLMMHRVMKSFWKYSFVFTLQSGFYLFCLLLVMVAIRLFLDFKLVCSKYCFYLL